MAAMPPLTIYMHTSDQPCPGAAAVAEGCTSECSEGHTFVPPCEQAIPPGEVTDTVYRMLHGARENLCRVQTVLPVVSWRAMLGRAVAHIDYVGSRECPEQWSKFDRDDRLPQPGVPTMDLLEVHDDKGHSEERCTRCGWVMGNPPLNCQNDNTPHVFLSQLAGVAAPDTEAVWSLRRILDAIWSASPGTPDYVRACDMLEWHVQHGDQVQP